MNRYVFAIALLLAVSAQGQPSQYKVGDTVLIHTNKMGYPYTHNAPKLPEYMFWRLYRNGENYPEWKNDWYRAEVDTANYVFVDEVWVRLHKIKLTAKQQERLMELLEPPITYYGDPPRSVGTWGTSGTTGDSIRIPNSTPVIPDWMRQSGAGSGTADTLPDSVWVPLDTNIVMYRSTKKWVCPRCGHCEPEEAGYFIGDGFQKRCVTTKTVFTHNATGGAWGWWKKGGR